jgi:hypothetical protein
MPCAISRSPNGVGAWCDEPVLLCHHFTARTVPALHRSFCCADLPCVVSISREFKHSNRWPSPLFPPVSSCWVSRCGSSDLNRVEPGRHSYGGRASGMASSLPPRHVIQAFSSRRRAMEQICLTSSACSPLAYIISNANGIDDSELPGSVICGSPRRNAFRGYPRPLITERDPPSFWFRVMHNADRMLPFSMGTMKQSPFLVFVLFRGNFSQPVDPGMVDLRFLGRRAVTRDMGDEADIVAPLSSQCQEPANEDMSTRFLHRQRHNGYSLRGVWTSIVTA